MNYEVAPQVVFRCVVVILGGATDWYQSTSYRELGRFQNLSYYRFLKKFKSLSPLSDIRACLLPGPSGELDGAPTLSDGRDTTKTVETNLVFTWGKGTTYEDHVVLWIEP
ncbi:hypothetical protein Tco_0277311 [Tanacetum coccineum]